MHRPLDSRRLNEYGVKLATFSRVALAAMLCAVAIAYAAPAQSQALTFTVETTTSGGSSIVPRLTWQTVPAATSCTASAVPAATDWTGNKAATGTVILAAINASRSYTIACQWPGNTSARLTWGAPTTNTDGSALTDLGGFRVVYGRSATVLDQSAFLQSPTTLTHTLEGLAAGSWFFGVHAFNTGGLEGPRSNVVSKVITAGTSQTRTLEVAVRFPSPPVLTVE